MLEERWARILISGVRIEDGGVRWGGGGVKLQLSSTAYRAAESAHVPWLCAKGNKGWTMPALLADNIHHFKQSASHRSS